MSPEFSRDRTLDLYLDEISKLPLLSVEEEKNLTRRIREGDKEALHRLVEGNLRFVIMIAKQYMNQGLSLADLINEGNLGLIRAAHRFDEKRGYKFISYAVWWIRQGILQALAEQSRIVRIPVNRAGLLHKINKVTEQLNHELGRKPEIREIAEKLNLSEEEIRETIQIANSHLSLDSFDDGEGDNNLWECLPDNSVASPDEILYSKALRDDIQKALSTLDDRERKIIILYYGLENGLPLTLEEIGQKMNLTRERIRQIKDKALSKLRRHSRSKYLEPYIDYLEGK